MHGNSTCVMVWSKYVIAVCWDDLHNLLVTVFLSHMASLE